MNLLPSQDQVQIIDALRDFLVAEAPVERLRVHGDIGNPDAPLLTQLGELGFLGLALPEADGGSGLTAAEEMLAARELGRFLVTPAVLGAMAGAHVLAEAGAADALAAVIAGTLRVGLANRRRLPGHGADDVHLIEAEGAGLVLAWDEAAAAVYPSEACADIAAVRGMDSSTALSRARLAGAPIAKTGLTASLRMSLLIAAYAVGMCEATRDMAVDYAKVREQFGKPIGSFQAIKHRCAEMAMRCEAAHCQTAFAALTLADNREDAAFHVTAAKIVATDAALKNAAANIQVHGAFGFTSKGLAHHYLKRGHLFDALGGDLRVQRARLLGLPTPA